jgi:hypothetical protein
LAIIEAAAMETLKLSPLTIGFCGVIMEMYHRQFPQYNFRQNKGYGTKEHLNAIRQFGICKIHRKSFHVKNLNQSAFDFAI